MKIQSVITLLFLVVFCSFISGCGGGGSDFQPVATQTGAVVSGQLQGSVVASIPVFLLKASTASLSVKASILQETVDTPSYETITDEKGMFTFLNVIPGNYRLIAQSGRFLQGVKDVVVNESQSLLTDLEISISPTGDIKGKLGLPEGFSSVGTRIFFAGTSYSSFSAADGSFTISGVPEGQFDLFADSAQLGLVYLGKISPVIGSIKDIGTQQLAFSAPTDDFLTHNTIRYGDQILTISFNEEQGYSLVFIDLATGQEKRSIPVQSTLSSNVFIAGMNTKSDLILCWWDEQTERCGKIALTTGVFTDMGPIGDLGGFQVPDKPYMYNDLLYIEGGGQIGTYLYIFDTVKGELIKTVTIRLN